MRLNPNAYFTSAWLPAWYMGDPYRTYYPPLTTLVLAPLVYLLRDPFLTYRVFVTLVLVLYGHFVYAAFIERTRHWSAALAVLLALYAPYTLRTLFLKATCRVYWQCSCCPGWSTSSKLFSSAPRVSASS